MPTDEAMALVRSKAGSQFDPAVVKILEERYIELEGKARTQGGGIAPLNTDIIVRRGEAPGAGFQKESCDSVAANAAGMEDGNSATSKESLEFIAAANHEAQTIFDMTQMRGSSLTSDETISVMSTRLRRLVPFDCFVIYLKTDESVGIHYIDGECAGRFTTARIPLGEGLSGWVSQNTKPILNGNPTVEPNYVATGGPSRPLHSALSIPLCDLKGEVFGALTVYSTIPDVFSRGHMRMLLAMEARLSMALKSLLEPRAKEADESFDPVTQLPNSREMFLQVEERLSAAKLAQEGLCVAVCSLNDFGDLCHLHGDARGELVLRKLGAEFRKTFNAPALAARTGEHEFGFLLTATNPQNVSKQLEAIEHSVRQTCRDLNLDLGVSTGTAFFPADGATAEALLATASRRMHLHQSGMQKHAPKRSKTHSLELAASA